MKITKEQLKRIIKEEIEEMNDPVTGETPDRGIPQIKGYDKIQNVLEQEFGNYQPDVASIADELYMVTPDQVEEFRNQLMNYQDGSVVSDFIGFVSEVIEEMR